MVAKRGNQKEKLKGASGPDSLRLPNWFRDAAADFDSRHGCQSPIPSFFSSAPSFLFSSLVDVCSWG